MGGNNGNKSIKYNAAGCAIVARYLNLWKKSTDYLFSMFLKDPLAKQRPQPSHSLYFNSVHGWRCYVAIPLAIKWDEK
jgi:hypothetical protein